MKRKRPTIHEVATRAGVGLGTVSRVLNNHKAVRPETRARVLRAMEELGYTPNPHARRIAGGRSYTVSILLPFVATEFYRRLIEGLEGVLLEKRYDLALFPILSQNRLRRYLESTTLAYLTDGLILASYDLTEHFDGGRLPTDRPVVLVDARNPRYDSVYLDNSLGGRLAGECLARFPGAIFAIKVEEEPDRAFRHTVFAERMAGFAEALATAGRPFPPEHLYTTRLSQEGGRLALRYFLERTSPPLNVFAGADLVALGVLEEAGRLGLTVGREVRVLGFDGHPFAEEVGLSTIAQPVEAMGAKAAQLLLDRMQGYTGPPREVRFEPILIERESTGAGAGAPYVP
ncbi:substrate-binding domain-containing protein [Thermus thermamylovorans]|uniref:LacI family DNA-binding transcriptional regulator n=1 Tax=Thermus thermamylovorans TaxID=2509362 RepID=A0A4Q9B5Y5_9DEIN|nr:substrate-binding domain-containing protein [Thermus thermamylovorans]TBH21450.1 LacI family DNA-binding transcriptional regulator [Thermus thermamylovorans]